MNIFWRRVLTVASGTGAAQLILLIVLPILTRELSKDIMGVYFYGISVATIFIVIGNLRLDMAIFTEDSMSGSMDVLRTSIQIAILMSSIFALITVSLSFFAILDYSIYFWLSVSLILFSLSFNSVLQSIYIQNTEYKKLSLNKVFQSLFISLGLLLFAKLAPSGENLLAVHALGLLLSCGLLISLLPILKNSRLFQIDLEKSKSILIKHKNFPLISMPAGLINSLSIQLPIIIIGFKFGASAVAIYALMSRVMLAPISLIGGSILSVFKEKAATEYRLTGQCTKSYKETFRSLLLISIIPLMIAMFSIKPLFILIFGEDWADSGTLAQIMLPMFFLKFISSPLSYTFFISNGQKYDLLWQISLLVFTLIAFLTTEDIFSAVQFYSILYAAHYLIYLDMSYNLSKPKALRAIN